LNKSIFNLEKQFDKERIFKIRDLTFKLMLTILLIVL